MLLLRALYFLLFGILCIGFLVFVYQVVVQGLASIFKPKQQTEEKQANSITEQNEIENSKTNA